MSVQTREVTGRFGTKTSTDDGPPVGTREHFYPLWIGLAIAAGSTLLWGITFLTGTGPILVITAVGSVIALLANIHAGRTHKWTVGNARAGVVATVAASLMAALWVTTGPSWLNIALAMTIGCVVSIPWWAKRYIPNVPPLEETPKAPMPQYAPFISDVPPDVPATNAEVIMERWDAHIASAGALKGSSLDVLEEQEHLAKFMVEFVPGTGQTFAKLQKAVNNIAVVMNRPLMNIVVEQNPETAANAVLTIVTGINLGKVNMWAGPQFNLSDGTVTLGNSVDDNTPAKISIVVKNGVFGCTYCGAQGMGKSAAMEQAVMSMLDSGLFTLLYVDPQGGMSSPALAKAATWCATSVEEGETLIEQLPQLRKYRQAKLAAQGKAGFTPSKEWPVVLVVIDECHEVFAVKKIRLTVEKIARTGRKVGISIMVATQDIGLASFGGSQSLRSQLTAKNVVYFATSSLVQGNLTGKNEFNPASLPSIPGYGYLKEVSSDDGQLLTKAAPFRSYHLGDAKDLGMNPGLWWLEKGLNHNNFATLDAGSAGALGDAFANRDAEREASEEANLELIAQCEAAGATHGGNGTGNDPAIDDLGTFGGSGMVATAEKPRPPEGPTTVDSMVPSFNFGLNRDTTRRATNQPMGDASSTSKPVALDAAAQKVLVHVRAGQWKPADIEKLTGYSAKWVNEQLKALISAGLVVKPQGQQGHYHAKGYEHYCTKKGCTSAA